MGGENSFKQKYLGFGSEKTETTFIKSREIVGEFKCVQ